MISYNKNPIAGLVSIDAHNLIQQWVSGSNLAQNRCCSTILFFSIFFEKGLIFENSYWALDLSEFDETSLVGFLAMRTSILY